MIQELEKAYSLVENWRDVRALLATYGPPALQQLREKSLRRFEGVGFPTHKTEEYKYTSLRPIEETEFKPAYGATVSKAEARETCLGKVEAITLAFVNGEYAPELSNIQALPEGAILLPMQEALESHEALVMNHLGQIATLQGKLGSSNDERFVWLNNAYISEGAFIYLPKNALVETPIHLQFLSKADHGPFAAFPRVLIVAEENAQARVIESYSGINPQGISRNAYLTCAVTELHLSRHANVEHIRVQNESTSAFHIATIQAHQEES